MSASAVSTPIIAEKKVRVPTALPAKFGKFIQFGYYLMNKLNACEEGSEDTPPVIDEEIFLNKLRLFDPLDHQQEFVQEFLDSSKEINQNLRKIVQQRKRDIAKSEKPKKEKKPRAPKEKKESDKSDESLPENDKKPRGKAKKVNLPTTEDQLVNELVQLAVGADKKESATAAVNVLLQDVPKIEVKEKPVKEVKEKPVKEVKEKPVKEVKEKPVKEDTPPHDDDDDDELQVSVFEFQSQKYLIDDNNNVYDFTTQDIIGKFIDNSISTL